MAADTDTEIDDTTLDSVLDKALENFDAPAAPETDSDEAPARDDGRDDKGRFANKAPKQDEGGVLAAAEVPAPETVSPETAPPAQAPVAPAWTDGHFTGWKPEQRERFKALPPDIQQLVMDRQSETQAFFQRKVSETSDHLKAAEPLLKAAQEVDPFARSIGTTPHDLVRNYAAIDQQLRYAPYAEKVQLLQKIAQSYGLPYAAPEADPFADPVQPNGQAYPVIHDLQSQVQRLTAQLSTYQQQTEAQSNQQVQSALQTFSTATDANGSPKYPYFDVVRTAMGQLIAQGQAQGLEDAYAQAVKPLEDKLQKELAARQNAAASAQAQAVAKAKKAAPIRSSGATAKGQTKGGGLDALLDAQLTSAGF